MAAKSEEPKQKVYIFTEEGEGGYSRAFSLTEVEIDKSVLLKNGKITFKSVPDLFGRFLDEVEEKARNLFGI